MKAATSGTATLKGEGTIPAGALAVGVGTANVVLALNGADPVNHQVLISKRAILAGLHVEGVVDAVNQVTLCATCVLTAGIVVPAAYIVDFQLVPIDP